MRTILAWLSGPLLLAVSACGAGGGDATGADGPEVVVTTSVLGDVVGNLVGDDVAVRVIVPAGTDPHDFAPSPRQVAELRSADAVVVNGLGLETGLLDAISAAEQDGATVLTAAAEIELIELDEAPDPHFFSDPVRMRQAAARLAQDLLLALPRLDTPAFHERVFRYLDLLAALDSEIEATLEPVAPRRRVLVTNHEVFGYFADRYGFELLGAVVPGGSTLAEPSASDLAALGEEIRRRKIPALFADASSPRRLIEALAGEVPSVEVVELYSEAVGEPGTPGATYVGMMRVNAERIAEALR